MSTALEEIKARAEGATEGPWSTRRFDLDLFVVAENGALNPINLGYVGNRPEDDAEFIAHARTDIPKLLAALEAVAGELAELDAIQAEHTSFFGGPNVTAGSVAANIRSSIEEALR